MAPSVHSFRVLKGGLCIAAVLLAAACGSSPSTSGSAAAGNSDPIQIGYNGELSGPSAAFGVPTLHGVQLAIAEANAAGGINGRQIQLLVSDNQGKAASAVSIQNQLVGNSSILAMLGLNFGADNKAALPVSDRAGMPTVTFDWTGLSYAGANRYAVTINVTKVNDVLLKILDLPQYKSVSRIALWAGDSPVFAAATSGTAAAIAAKAGFQPKVIYYPEGAPDLTAQAQQLIDYNPQVVFDTGATAAENVAPMKEAQRQGALKSTVWIGSTFVIPGVTKVAGPAVTAGAVSVTLVDFNKPEVIALGTKVEAQFSEPLSYGQVQGYDAANTLIQALKQPGATASRSALNQALSGLKNVKPVGGPPGYTFSFAPGAGSQHDAFGVDGAYSFVQLKADGTIGAFTPS
ncbi:MAG TPA: ABC transporter substrate-binding protein [Candidatus Dormibacteraeota bacterium]|jgi:branched-chain amino acid transport system substrate-binding protein|nr:ABC transporter substrate-binding protein [Candidatus Dormibacteraeota bacterium]